MEPVFMGTVPYLKAWPEGLQFDWRGEILSLSHDRSRFHARDKDWDQRGRLNQVIFENAINENHELWFSQAQERR